MEAIFTFETTLRDLRLFALMPVMKSNDRSRGPIWGIDSGQRAGSDCNISVIHPSMHFESLIMVGLVVNEDCVGYFAGCGDM
jgi:hypothetical protein